MTGQNEDVNKDQSASIPIETANQNDLCEDKLYLKNILISVRALQTKMRIEQLEEGDELEIDTNLSEEELKRIIHLCVEEKNRDIGIQVLYELFDYEELILNKLSKDFLIGIWERLTEQLPESLSKDSLLIRLKKFLL